ncbi:hypothetical protein ABI59_15345 [Acidobacteria bacterium Mor1]|nr:hypothetical protein ABI59_15345 [Acidobacteria bacterium Mor1]
MSLILAFSILAPVVSADAGDWVVRTRLIFIEPDDGATGVLETDLNAGVESDVTVEFDATYFFTDRFAIEGILATASQEVVVNDGSGETSLGSVLHAPATFLAQYHFGGDGKFHPYVGLGINYTIFYDESGDLTTLDLDSGSFGPAAQFGVDVDLSENKVFNFDLKYAEIETDVASMGTNLGTVEVNPLIVGFGFGFRF